MRQRFYIAALLTLALIVKHCRRKYCPALYIPILPFVSLQLPDTFSYQGVWQQLVVTPIYKVSRFGNIAKSLGSSKLGCTITPHTMFSYSSLSPLSASRSASSDAVRLVGSYPAGNSGGASDSKCNTYLAPNEYPTIATRAGLYTARSSSLVVS